MGWTRRPFSAYDPNRMCSTCAAYFHVEMAAQILHRIYCLDAKEEARNKAQKASQG